MVHSKAFLTESASLGITDIKQTFDEYSSFVTKFDNDNYDQSLPAAAKLYAPAAKRSDEREIEEAKLVSSFLTNSTFPQFAELSIPHRKRQTTRLKHTSITLLGRGKSRDLTFLSSKPYSKELSKIILPSTSYGKPTSNSR